MFYLFELCSPGSGRVNSLRGKKYCILVLGPVKNLFEEDNDEDENALESFSGPPARSGDGGGGASGKQKKKQKTKRKPVNVRKEFPETWLWTEEMVK